MSDKAAIASHTPSFVLIGLPGDRTPCLEKQPEVQSVIKNHSCFSGGQRHYELLRPFLPENHEWIPVQAPLEKTLERYRDKEHIVIFVSGDPFFFGFGKTVKKHFPEAPVRSYPASNSLQMLAQKLEIDYGNVVPLSLHGRQWHRLHALLLRGETQLGVLTDEASSPDTLARHLIAYRYGHYHFYIGEKLGSTEERVQSLSAEEAAQSSFDPLNCVIISSDKATPAQTGWPEDAFYKLPGKPGMITKTSVRLFTLALLELHKAERFWDIGTCTGSMAIDAQCMNPELEVTAFEKKTEAFKVLDNNLQKSGTPGIRLIKNDFLEPFPEELAKTTCDRVFVGGHGGNLEKILDKCDQHLNPGGLIGLNAIRKDSLTRFKDWIEQQPKYQLVTGNTLQQGHENPITIIIAQKQHHESQ